MGNKKAANHPHDKKDGLIVFPISVLKSRNYLTMYPFSQRLMPFLQSHWYEDRPVAFSISEAMRVLDCSKSPALKAFDELQERGFIVKVDESIFNSRSQSFARTWRLTWMPYNWMQPTKEWKKWTKSN